MTERDFIKENIVGRRESWRKRIRHYLRVIFSALVFGAVSAVVFAVTEPMIRERLEPEERPMETVTLGSEEATESAGTDALETVESTEAIEDVVQTEMENYRFSIDAYESMIEDLAGVATAADYSVVEVKSIINGTDFLGGQMETADTYAGIVIATTADEVLVLTAEEAVSAADSIQVKLRTGSVLQGSLKGVDGTDGLAIVSIAVQNLLQSELDQIKAITLGSSNRLRKGEAIIAVGAPAGVLHSTAYGFVSFIATNYPVVDGSSRVLVSDLTGNARMGTFILNTSGELVGWITTKFGAGEDAGYSRIAGISDFMERIERLSNEGALPYFGIVTQEVSRSMQENGLPAGIYVTRCEQNSPAYQAGIQSGDIVTGINADSVTTVQAYTEALSRCMIGQEAQIQVLRQSGDTYKEMTFYVTTATR